MFSGAGIGEGYLFSPLTGVLSSFVQFIISWYLIKKSADIATYICNAASFTTSIKLTASPKDLLFILIVSIGIYYLLDAMLPFIKGLILEFRDKAPHNSFNDVQVYKPTDWLAVILGILLPVFLLAFSKPVAEYFSKDLDKQEAELSEINDDHLNNFEE